MQEYVEAATFAHYCRHGEVASLEVLNQQHGEGLQNLRVLEADYVLGVRGAEVVIGRLADWQIGRLADSVEGCSSAHLAIGRNGYDPIVHTGWQKHGKNMAKHGKNTAKTRQSNLVSTIVEMHAA